MNSLDSNREQAENKLILLYLIKKIGMAVSNLQLIKLVLENGFMNFFLLQQYLNELYEGKMLTCEQVDGKNVFLITETGRKTLEYLTNLIPPGIKARIDNTLAETCRNIRNETLVTADYTPENENEYIVECAVREDNFSLMELKVAVGTKKDARAFCDNWKNHAQEIYAEIIDSLIKDRNKKNQGTNSNS